MEQNKFNSWADYYFTKDNLNQYLRLQQCIDDCNTKFELNLSKETFRGLLLRWCERYGYELNPYNMLDDNRKLFRNFKGFDGVQEAIYIKKTDFPKQPEATTSQWEVSIGLYPEGYYGFKTNSIGYALEMAANFNKLTKISRLSIRAIEPQEAAK